MKRKLRSVEDEERIGMYDFCRVNVKQLGELTSYLTVFIRHPLHFSLR